VVTRLVVVSTAVVPTGVVYISFMVVDSVVAFAVVAITVVVIVVVDTFSVHQTLYRQVVSALYDSFRKVIKNTLKSSITYLNEFIIFALVLCIKCQEGNSV